MYLSPFPFWHEHKMRYGENVALYKFRDSYGREVWIREDLPVPAYGQGPHFNVGPGGIGENGQMNLPSHFFWNNDW